MSFDDFGVERRFHEAWDAIRIARPVSFSLFTFGETELPYYLVCHPQSDGATVKITEGEIKVTRPMLITPDNMDAEFRNFFESQEEHEMVQFLMKRTVIPQLKFDNTSHSSDIRSDSVEEAVALLNRKLDAEEQERVAVLTAPPELAGIALLRYALERVIESQPHNVQELRERGFLP
ncbi:hypothetical protein Pan258_02980 [Symmachiella dynata]|uniref:hypothetical protein n=1 Tax=Symmachiella dynata TaxID=2527995 RepID=UPI00118A288C|nr:hypothetical protein [Symmachiella dynata]QDT46280.1 hypothetical protein Pan258_02980 [Symmachiella dynata]